MKKGEKMSRMKRLYLICSIALVPVAVSATHVDNYPAVQKLHTDTSKPKQADDGMDIYAEFKKIVSDLSPEDRAKLKKIYIKKIESASEANNFEEAAYYSRLYDILDSFDE